jgi:hypothetical protein
MFDYGWDIGYYDPRTGIRVGVGGGTNPPLTQPGFDPRYGYDPRFGVQRQNDQILWFGLIVLGAVLLLNN